MLKYFDADTDPASGNLFDPGSRILDPGWKKFGSAINIPDPQHWYLERFIPDPNSDPDTGPTIKLKL